MIAPKGKTPRIYTDFADKSLRLYFDL